MPIELLCGQCQGRFAAEQPGGVVACPHCGAHLQVPGEPAGMNLQPPSQILPADNGHSPAGELITSNLEAADELEPQPPAMETAATLVTVSETMALEEAAPSAIIAPAAIPLSELASHSTPRMPLPEAAAPTVAAFAAPDSATPMAAASVAPPPAASVAPPAPPTTPAAAPASRLAVDLPSAATVPKFWFTLLLGYSSAATLALLFLLYVLGRIKSHPLESLPDIKPEVRKGEVELKVALPRYDVAPGHVLRIGETRRFGSLKVTPLKVTQGPLRFEHALKAPTAQRPPSQPVLKLWVKFENVSRNQTFSPLDPELLFRRKYQGFGRPSLTNQFLCKESERLREGGDLRYLFEQSTTSEFHLAGQQLDNTLGPGQAYETFIPSEEFIDKLDGDLVWRLQFRKGYHPRTRHGVTTLIDVPFARKDVKLES